MKRILFVFLTAFSLLLSAAENLLTNPSFEDGLEGWSNPGWLKNLVVPQIDKNVFAAGQQALRISGEPGKVGNVHQAVKIPEGTKEVTFAGQIKTSGLPRGWCASIHLDCYVVGNKRVKTFIKGTSWEKPENEWTLFGECVQLPEGTLRVDVALRVHNANTYKGTPDNAGSAWFDELAVYAGNVPEVLLKKESATKVALQSVEPEKIGGVFLPGEEVVLKCKFDKDGRTANYAVVDFYGKTVLDGKVDESGAIAFAAPKRNGYYVVKVSLTDGHYGEKTGSFIVAEKVESPDPFFAMCHHYMTLEFLPAARALGYGSMTIPVLVYKVEPQPGKYVFEHPDQWLELVEKLGMKPNGFFSFSGRSSWALPAW